MRERERERPTAQVLGGRAPNSGLPVVVAFPVVVVMFAVVIFEAAVAFAAAVLASSSAAKVEAESSRSAPHASEAMVLIEDGFIVVVELEMEVCLWYEKDIICRKSFVYYERVIDQSVKSNHTHSVTRRRCCQNYFQRASGSFFLRSTFAL